MTFFVNQENYEPLLSHQAGIRVLLHRQGELPMIADQGFNAATGLVM